MLCPKCDYISFDHLETCAKCKHPLAETAALLGGTSVNASQINYLGMMEEAQPAEDVFDGSESDVAATGIEEGGGFADVEEERSLDEESDELEEASASADVEVDEESVVLEVPDLGGIEFDGIQYQEDSMPEAEIKDETDVDVGDSEELTAEAAEEPAPEDLKFDLDEIETVPSEEGDSTGLELDDSALTLESDDDQEEDVAAEETLTAEVSGTDADDAGQTGIDLGDIDLSDLVHAVDGEEKESADKEISEHSEQSEESSLGNVAESDLHLSMVGDDEDAAEVVLEGADETAEVGEAEEREVDSTSELNDETGSPEGLVLEGAEETAGPDAVSDEDDLIDLSDADDDVFDGLDFSVDSPDEDIVDLSLEEDDDK